MDSRAHARAAVVAGAIETSVIEPTRFHLRQKPALRSEVGERRLPLDLTASVFRYIARLNGSIEPLRDGALVHACGRSHPHALPRERR